MKLFFSLVLTFLALLGIFDAGYITYSEVTGKVLECKPPFACSSVLDSPWSKIGPVPLAAFGVIYYSWMLLLGILLTLEVKVPRLNLTLLALVSGSGGFLFSLWLLFVMGVVLKAWCLYCLLSALNCIVIFTVVLSNYLLSRQPENTRKPDEVYL